VIGYIGKPSEADLQRSDINAGDFVGRFGVEKEYDEFLRGEPGKAKFRVDATRDVISAAGTLEPWALSHRSWKKRPYYNLVERKSLKACAAIHVASEAEAASIEALGFGEKVVCVPFGIELPEAGVEHRDHGGPLRLLSMSRLHPVKNLPVVFRAMASEETPRTRFTVAGVRADGPEDYEDQLRREVREEVGLEITQIENHSFRDALEDKIYPGGETRRVYMIYLIFRCRAIGTTVRLNEEFERHAWVQLEDLGDYDLNPATRQTLLPDD